MNGLIKRIFATICIGGAVAVGGCCTDSSHSSSSTGTNGGCANGNCGSGGFGDFRLCNYYDNCWLERNAYQAAQSVDHAFGAQVNNGHVLDQAIFTYDFDDKADTLTKGGIERLKYLARRRPEPDSRIYLQTAQDVEYDPAAPEKYAAARSELDAKRVAAIQKFLQADTTGRGVSFQVITIDAPTPGIAARPIGIALQKNYLGFQGSLPAGGYPGSTPSGGAGGGGAPSGAPSGAGGPGGGAPQ